MYHVRPIRPVPKWLKVIKSRLSCRFISPFGRVVPINDLRNPADRFESHLIDNPLAKETKKDRYSIERIAAAAIQDIRVLSQKVQSTDEQDTLIEEWKLVADIADRFFFYLSLSMQIMMAIVCFVIIPYITY